MNGRERKRESKEGREKRRRVGDSNNKGSGDDDRDGKNYSFFDLITSVGKGSTERSQREEEKIGKRGIKEEAAATLSGGLKRGGASSQEKGILPSKKRGLDNDRRGGRGGEGRGGIGSSGGSRGRARLEGVGGHGSLHSTMIRQGEWMEMQQEKEIGVPERGERG